MVSPKKKYTHIYSYLPRVVMVYAHCRPWTTPREARRVPPLEGVPFCRGPVLSNKPLTPHCITRYRIFKAEIALRCRRAPQATAWAARRNGLDGRAPRDSSVSFLVAHASIPRAAPRVQRTCVDPWIVSPTRIFPGAVLSWVCQNRLYLRILAASVLQVGMSFEAASSRARSEAATSVIRSLRVAAVWGVWR